MLLSVRVCLLAGLLITAPFVQAAPTFYKDIAPITNQYCVSCHRPGEPGPFSLLTYEDVKKRGPQIASVTRSRYMPPWLPEHGYGHFADERRLTEAQLNTIEQWVRSGMPAGAEADAPPAPKFTPGWQLGQPDLIVTAAEPYTLRADGPDQFWNFVLRLPLEATRYVRAVEIRPGNPRAVHHANLLIDRTRSSRLREATPGSGFEGMDLTIESDTFEPDSHFLFWKPGAPPVAEPDGMALRLDRGTDLVLNVHLQTTGKAEEIQPSVGLFFTDKPQTKFPMLLQLESDGALKIPPGVKDFQVSDTFRVPVDLNVLAVYPHAHYLGKLLEGWAILPDGSRKWLIRIPDWNQSWQAVYPYAEPVFLPKGTVIYMSYHYDNSAANPRNPFHPPRLVVGGNQSTDEMSHLWLQVLARGGKDQRQVIQEAVMRRRLEKYPADFSAHLNLGSLLMVADKPEAALPYLQDAVNIQPEQPVGLNTLGSALLASGREDEAIGCFRHALQVQPGYTNARYNLANALADQGDLEQAAGAFEAVLKDNPDDVKARDHLFEVLKAWGNQMAKDGKFADAASRMRQALAIHNEDAELHNNLGIMLARTGDRVGAAAEFEAALKVDPSNEAAKRNLAIATGASR
jgi:Flp pilus assembly protein TadD